jgi:hypothetical protein
MIPLPAAVSAALDRFVQTFERDSPSDRVFGQLTLTDLLAAVALHARPVRWFDSASAAYVHLTTQTRARIAAELQSADETDDLDQRVFNAAEGAFDAGWANGWSELDAGLQIAAGRGGLVDRMQAACRLWLDAMEAHSVTATLERALADAEEATAGAAFDVPLGSLAASSEYPDEADGLRDIARDRVRRHRADVSSLAEAAIRWLAVADAAECARAQPLAERVLDTWAAGVRLIWVCPHEVVLVGSGERSVPGRVAT